MDLHAIYAVESDVDTVLEPLQQAAEEFDILEVIIKFKPFVGVVAY